MAAARLAKISSLDITLQRWASLQCQVVEDFALLRFLPLAIQDKESVQRVVSEIDKATGYVFTGLAQAGETAYPPEFLYGAASHEGKASDVTQRYKEQYEQQYENHVQESNLDFTAAGYKMADIQEHQTARLS